MMAQHIESYILKIRLKNEYLAGCLVGSKGAIVKEMKAATGAHVGIHQKNVEIEGSVESVKAAEKLIMDKINSSIFEVSLTNAQAGLLRGRELQTLKTIQTESKAHVSISNIEREKLLLRIIGRSDSFSTAMKLVLDKFEFRLRKQINYIDSKRCFRQVELKKGTYQASYVQDQLKPNPHLVFLDFHATLNDNEKEYKTKELDKSKLNPPSSLCKQVAILAPYHQVMYRAEVMNIVRSSDGCLNLTVKFIDFGNICEVNFFECQDIKTEHLFPPKATACEINNIKQDKGWKKETLKAFTQILNNESEVLLVKINHEVTNNKIASVDVKSDLGFDVASILVNSGVANWNDDPFEPISIVTEDRIGSCDLLYVIEGRGGGLAQVDVVSNDVTVGEKVFTCTSNFQNDQAKDSIATAHKFCQNYLKKRENRFLDTHSIHVSVEETGIHKFYGGSGGVGFALCILSECLQIEIPNNIAVTGQITGHGKIEKVSGLREKIIAAANNNKKKVFVPAENIVESLDLEIHDTEIIPVKDMYDVIGKLWNMK